MSSVVALPKAKIAKGVHFHLVIGWETNPWKAFSCMENTQPTLTLHSGHRAERPKRAQLVLRAARAKEAMRGSHERLTNAKKE